MAASRRIEGSIGSRIRVILGDTGNDWLLILNHDDGTRQWQTHHMSATGIPNKVRRQLTNCTNKNRIVKEVDFGPTGAWYVHGEKRDGTARHLWWDCPALDSQLKDWRTTPYQIKVNLGTAYGRGREASHVLLLDANGYACSPNVDEDLQSRIATINSERLSIRLLRLFANGSYFISDDRGTVCKNLGEHCMNEVTTGAGGMIEEVAWANDGSWIVARSDQCTCSASIDSTLREHLQEFYRDQAERNERMGIYPRDYIYQNLREGLIRMNEYYATQREALAATPGYQERIQSEIEMERIQREFARQATEDAEQERRHPEARAAAERTQQVLEAREALENARRAVQEAESKRAAALEASLEERILEQVSDSIKEAEDLRDKLLTRKRSLEHSIQTMSSPRRARLEAEISKIASGHDDSTKPSKAVCVVCYDNEAVRAVIPCGHHCLCDECAHTISTSSHETQLCPLCRARLQSTLKIFSSA